MKNGSLFNRHKFLDDYVVINELNSNGKNVKKAYYNAEYYETDWTDTQTKTFKRTALALSIICLAASVIPISVYCDAMATMYVIMAFVVAMILSIFMFVSSLDLPKNSGPMERSRKYYGFEKLRTRTLIVCFMGLYGALMNAAFCFIIFPKYSETARLYTGMDIAVSLCGLITAGAAYYCLRRLKTANVHRSEKESEWQRIRREMEEHDKETDTAEP